MHIIKKLFDGAVLLANLILLMIFIASAYSDYISPVTSVYPSYLGILFPFFFAGIILFIVYWLFRVKWYALISIVGILVCWEPVTRYMPYHISDSKPTSDTIKLLTYNTCAMGRYDITQNKKRNDVIDFINKQDADIVCLQEYVFKNSSEAFSEKFIRKNLSKYPYYSFQQLNHNSQYGLAIFSKHKIKSTKPIKYKSLYNNSCLYTIEVNGKQISLINNHLESNKLTKEDREFYDSMIENFETDKIQTMRSTLIHKLSDAYMIRAEQAETLRDVIGSQKNPVIVCGDFNDTPISYCYQTIRGNLTDAFRNSGSGIGITFHENKFLFRIDHIFHSNNINSYNARVHKVNYSDHYPVTVTLEIP